MPCRERPSGVPPTPRHPPPAPSCPDDHPSLTLQPRSQRRCGVSLPSPGGSRPPSRLVSRLTSHGRKTSARTRAHTHAHICTQTHSDAHVRTHTYRCTHSTHTLTYAHRHTHPHTHSYAHTHAHTQAHRHTQIHTCVHTGTRVPEAGQGVGLPSAPGPASRPARSLTRPRPSVLRGPREVSSVVRMARGGRGPGGAGQRMVPTRGHLRAGPSFASTAVRPAIAMATAPCRLGEQPTALRGAAPTRLAATASDFGSRCSRRSPALGGWVSSRFSVSAASPDARAPDLNPHWPESLRLDLASSRPGPAARWVPCRAPGMRSEGRCSGTQRGDRDEKGCCRHAGDRNQGGFSKKFYKI